jgi:hypothetical protein
MLSVRKVPLGWDMNIWCISVTYDNFGKVKPQMTLTREEILAMEPGQELSELVAVHVMGYEVGVVSLGQRNPSEDMSATWEMESKIIEKSKEINPSVQNLCADYVEKLRMVIKHEYIHCSAFMLVHATPELHCKAALLAELSL